MSPTSLSLVLVLASIFLYHLRSAYLRRKLPPGPNALPIIGNLHMLGKFPHQTFFHLAKKYGPIMSLRLGSVPIVIVSSPEIAELFLKTHDAVFAVRPIVQAIENGYGSNGMVFAHGDNWRKAKRLVTHHLLSPSKIESFAPIRKAEVEDLVALLRRAAIADEMVDLTAKLRELGANIYYKMILGRSEDDTFNLKEIVTEALNIAGQFNITDYVPWLGPLDLQQLVPRFKSVKKNVDTIFETIIDEHEQDIGQKQQKDLVDSMLSLVNQSMGNNNHQEINLDRTKMKGIILETIAASFDTSVITIEWALAELERHPQMKSKLQKELEVVVGKNRKVEETDLAKLEYLDWVVKETLRLHPPVPLLLPRETTQDITINGYDIPKKSRVFVNAWGMGRDPNVWSENAEEFVPERFSGSNIDIRGNDFQLIPFGSGRRSCPGLQIAMLTVNYVLAQLLHCFDLELPHGMLSSELDMTEEFGITLPRASHLFVKPTYRLVG